MKNLFYLLFALPLLFSCGGVDYEPIRGTYSGTLYVGDGGVAAQAILEVGFTDEDGMDDNEVQLTYTLFGKEYRWLGFFEEWENEGEYVMYAKGYPKKKNEFNTYPLAIFSKDKKTVKLRVRKDGDLGPYNGTLTKN